MRQAISEARLAFDQGEVPIGAVVVLAKPGRRPGPQPRGNPRRSDPPTPKCKPSPRPRPPSAENICRNADSTSRSTLRHVCRSLFLGQLGAVIYGADDPKRGFSRLQSPLFHPRTESDAASSKKLAAT